MHFPLCGRPLLETGGETGAELERKEARGRKTRSEEISCLYVIRTVVVQNLNRAVSESTLIQKTSEETRRYKQFLCRPTRNSNRLAAGRAAQLSMLSTSAPKGLTIKARFQSANFANCSRRPRVIGLINKRDKHPCRNIHVTQSSEWLVCMPSWCLWERTSDLGRISISQEIYPACMRDTFLMSSRSTMIFETLENSRFGVTLHYWLCDTSISNSVIVA